ncbi:MAG: alkaline phosphatase D family protein [Rhodothermales bacterium]
MRTVVVDDFAREDALGLGDGWESVNPGYWRIENQRMRRRLENMGDRRPTDSFPWHWRNRGDQHMPIDYDVSLPYGMIWRRDWWLRGNYSIQLDFTIHAVPAYREGTPNRQDRPGYALFGLCFGSECLNESWTGSQEGDSFIDRLLPGSAGDSAAWMAIWTDDGRFGVYPHTADTLKPVDSRAEIRTRPPREGDTGSILLFVDGTDPRYASIEAMLFYDDTWHSVTVPNANREAYTEGFFGVVGRGMLDMSFSQLMLAPRDNEMLETPLNELHVAYALLDSLREEDGIWRCTFMALFRNEGGVAQLRIADTETPAAGWESIPLAAEAPVITNAYRRNTAVLEAILPFDPSSRTLYYTVWKNGIDYTADPRIGTASVGAGTGFIGTVPSSGLYTGRLPRLEAPYKLCGLSCHSIHANGPNLPRAEKYQAWYVHDQPTPEGYQHLEAYDFQIMLWEDDVWYLELMFPPPSADDAYKVITTTLAGPTTRWQMMRHWNVVNPGDHDYGMDDVKGPEQRLVRQEDDLGQDAAYMRRNFQMVRHLMSGDENPDPTANPRNWRRWRSPAGDFSLYIMDARLWRTSQDTRIWDDNGWGHKPHLYDRTDPTRTLLGEEQFAWLQQNVRTDASPLICVTGINGLHTIWSGVERDDDTRLMFNQDDRVTADYAGWVAAGSDRVLELFGSRDGIVTVYGDVHNGCIMKNTHQGVAECCFGPIGRNSGRTPKENFGRQMTDYDGRPLEVSALYHEDYHSPDLDEASGPFYWNFLEMAFDPRPADPVARLAIRNLVDAPDDTPRGGGSLTLPGSAMGRPRTSRLPDLVTLPLADVQLARLTGEPVRAFRSDAAGRLRGATLIDIPPDTALVMTAHSSSNAEARIIQSLPL